MKVKNIIDEDCQNYSKVSMFIGTAFCDWKCCKECGEDICQNMPLAASKTLDINDIDIIRRYMENELSSAIVFGGLEPFDQFEELLELIAEFRAYTSDDIVIYTGYKEEEVSFYLEELEQFNNIIIKFGRYIPYSENRYDRVLGVTLASHNQYARKIS